ncbi:hypothetical protein FNO01nite_19230 [Flavobacterium noncentrifugens]|nr:hypothetical protein FNO01nite_19230 [Flavobacterium noncentrifugens]
MNSSDKGFINIENNDFTLKMPIIPQVKAIKNLFSESNSNPNISYVEMNAKPIVN